MNAITVCRTVKDTQTCHLVRLRKDAPGEYDAKPYGGGSKRRWFFVDLFSASAVCSVYDALNEENRARYASLPIQKMATVAFKLLK